MSDTAQFTIGTEASCTDGVCGEVSRVVIDPVARAVTHLVVEPKHRRRHGRLVPLDLVDASDGIRLRCTLAEFEQLEHAEEARFLPGSSYAGYGPDQALSWPYYGSRMPTNTNWFGMGRNAPTAKAPRGAVVVDAIPLSEVAVRRGEPVHATDGDIGRVQGLVINPDRHVTHVLLQEGHLWGRRQVAIPIGSVTRVDDGIRLDLTKQEVHDLAPVEIEHPDH
jgi:sporulation protein YlmC with PRC-barrel domain